jgi:hypothetical protein
MEDGNSSSVDLHLCQPLARCWLGIWYGFHLLLPATIDIGGVITNCNLCYSLERPHPPSAGTTNLAGNVAVLDVVRSWF